MIENASVEESWRAVRDINGHTRGRHFLPNPRFIVPSIGRRGGHYLNFVPADSSFQRPSLLR